VISHLELAQTKQSRRLGRGRRTALILTYV
jgi:hypothetical protein